MTDVFETRDITLLRSLLERDRVAAAYLLGDLEAPFFELGRWVIAVRHGAPTAIVLVFEAFADPVILSFGDVEGVDTILQSARSVTGLKAGGPTDVALPERCNLKIPPEHEGGFNRAFAILEREVMKVMALDGGKTEALPNRRAWHDVRPLTPAFPIDQILDVYRSYPGHFFEPGQLKSGIYFGSFEANRLVAIAGTHVFSPAGRVAAVGNIVTVADARGRGHASACTRAVVDALRERGCETIALHVAESNAPALACYRGLGFREYGMVLQLKGRATPRAASGP